MLEKAHEFGEIGAGIQIAPNGSRMLDVLGILDEIHTYAVYPQRLILVDALSGKLLTTLNFGEKFQHAYRYPYLVMHRNDLLTILLFAISDRPVLQALHLYREEELAECQEITSTFASLDAARRSAEAD